MVEWTWVCSKSRLRTSRTMVRLRKKRTWSLNSVPKVMGNQRAVGVSAGSGSVGDGEAEAGDAGAEEGADGEGNVAGHGGVDEDGLEGGGVDVGVALPAVVVFVAGAEGDVEAVAAVDGAAAGEGIEVVGLHFGGEGEEAGADAVFGGVRDEVLAHVFDEVEVQGIVVADGGFSFDLGFALGGGELGVVDVAALVEEAAVEGEERLVGAFVGGNDAEVGELFAVGGLAFAREGVGVLHVEVVGAGGLGAVLVGGDTRHDAGCRELLRARGDGEEREEESCEGTHACGYAVGAAKFRGRGRDREKGEGNWKINCGK